MAVSKAISKCIPFINSNNKVDKWDITMKYENDSEGDASYYTTDFSIIVNQKDVSPDGTETTNFTLKQKGSWTNAQLVALCPVSQWDAVFASQVDSVITNPPCNPVPDDSFPVPS